MLRTMNSSASTHSHRLFCWCTVSDW